jgi:DNA-binding CsgD family transcriptional regulator
VVREVETVRTFLTASEIDRLVADYQVGVGVLELAHRYGIHRATVAAHLRRRNMPPCGVGLDVTERAETVRFYREGLSLREIGRRLGVDRKTVRASLVKAQVEIRRWRCVGAREVARQAREFLQALSPPVPKQLAR